MAKKRDFPAERANRTFTSSQRILALGYLLSAIDFAIEFLDCPQENIVSQAAHVRRLLVKTQGKIDQLSEQNMESKKIYIEDIPQETVRS